MKSYIIQNPRPLDRSGDFLLLLDSGDSVAAYGQSIPEVCRTLANPSIRYVYHLHPQALELLARVDW